MAGLSLTPMMVTIDAVAGRYPDRPADAAAESKLLPLGPLVPARQRARDAGARVSGILRMSTARRNVKTNVTSTVLGLGSLVGTYAMVPKAWDLKANPAGTILSHLGAVVAGLTAHHGVFSASQFVAHRGEMDDLRRSCPLLFVPEIRSILGIGPFGMTRILIDRVEKSVAEGILTPELRLSRQRRDQLSATAANAEEVATFEKAVALAEEQLITALRPHLAESFPAAGARILKPDIATDFDEPALLRSRIDEGLVAPDGEWTQAGRRFLSTFGIIREEEIQSLEDAHWLLLQKYPDLASMSRLHSADDALMREAVLADTDRKVSELDGVSRMVLAVVVRMGRLDEPLDGARLARILRVDEGLAVALAKELEARGLLTSDMRPASVAVTEIALARQIELSLERDDFMRLRIASSPSPMVDHVDVSAVDEEADSERRFRAIPNNLKRPLAAMIHAVRVGEVMTNEILAKIFGTNKETADFIIGQLQERDLVNAQLRPTNLQIYRHAETYRIDANFLEGEHNAIKSAWE